MKGEKYEISTTKTAGVYLPQDNSRNQALAFDFPEAPWLLLGFGTEELGRFPDGG